MNAYVGFLYDRERLMPTVNWLRSELKRAPIAGNYARALLDQMVRLLPLTNPDFLPTNGILWRYLAAHKKWEPQEESPAGDCQYGGGCRSREGLGTRRKTIGSQSRSGTNTWFDHAEQRCRRARHPAAPGRSTADEE